MMEARGRPNLALERIRRLVKSELEVNPSWQFARDVLRLIWAYRVYSLAIFVVTIFQEYAALWPVNLLGQFIDRLASGDLGDIVWLFLAASLLYPGLARANVMLRHKMFYETDFQKMVELVLRVADRGRSTDPEMAGAAYSRAANAVGGITNTAYHILGSFTPVIIKIIIVAGSPLRYNRLLGLVYLLTLVVPALMTVLFNKKLRVLLDSQYSVISDLSGVAIKTINERGDLALRERFQEIMHMRKGILIALIYKSQAYLYAREVMLVGSQFLVVFLALAWRAQLNLTPGDFTRIIGYTAQVAAAFIGAASCLDSIVSCSRAYHIFARADGD